MKKDYIPRPEAALIDWLENFHAQLTAKKTALNVPDAALSKLATVKDDFKAKVADTKATKLAYETALTAEKAAHRAVVAEARALAQQVQREPATTNTDRTQLGLPVRDTEPTPAPPPDSFPLVQVDTATRFQHGLRWTDSKTPTSRAKPPGVEFTEIAQYIGTTAPAGPSQFKLIDTTKKTTHIAHYTETDVGKTAFVILRWVNSRGEKGPWSEVVSATITG